MRNKLQKERSYRDNISVLALEFGVCRPLFGMPEVVFVVVVVVVTGLLPSDAVTVF